MTVTERQAAGCVVFREQPEGLYVLLIHLCNRLDPRLPKGGVELGETYEECAIRETEEETGYQVKLTSGKPIIVEAIKDRRQPILRLRIHFYLATAYAGSPEVRKDIDLVTKVEWRLATEAVKLIRFPEEREALRRCLESFHAS
ncbi:MAG: NUDIX domain-containing protein, partial [Gorillibacterium sp.]|nr:NUDIX domain-containing protein [Gorillibacterium sp.]